MGRETKIGLTVIMLLLGVFGLVVYFKIFRPEPGPTAEALANALVQPRSASTGDDGATGGGKVQLSASSDERAPVDMQARDPYADDNYSHDADRYQPSAASAQAASPAWSEAPMSSRRGYGQPKAYDAADDGYDAAGDAARNYADDPYTDDNSDNGSYAADSYPPDDEADDRVGERDEIPAADDDAARYGVAPRDLEYEADELHQELHGAPRDNRFEALHDDLADENADELADEIRDDLAADYPDDDDDAIDPPAALAPVEPVELRPHPMSAPHGNVAQVGGAAPIDDRPADVSPSAAAGTRPLPPRRMAEAAAPRGQNFQGRDEQYVIQPNDNYWRISEKLYGTGAYFKALFEHNRKQFPRADRLRQGDTISVPPIEVLERTYPDLCPRPQHKQVEQNLMRSVSARRLPRGAAVYVVEEGDTLFDIARYELGQASRWGEIYELNRDVLGEQTDHLKPGMELILPATQVRESIAREGSGGIR